MKLMTMHETQVIGNSEQFSWACLHEGSLLTSGCHFVNFQMRTSCTFLISRKVSHLTMTFGRVDESALVCISCIAVLLFNNILPYFILLVNFSKRWKNPKIDMTNQGRFLLINYNSSTIISCYFCFRKLDTKFRQSIDINYEGILHNFEFDQFSIDDVVGKWKSEAPEFKFHCEMVVNFSIFLSDAGIL